MSKALQTSQAVAVIGSGTMGCGIALVAATARHRVLLLDAVPEAIQRGLERLRADLSRLVSRGKITAEARDARLALIEPAPNLDSLAPAALIVEAIVEDLDIKGALLSRVEALVAPDAILATNTSSLSITALAARLRRPERVVGMHFFNPAQVLPLVEIVSGHLTDTAVAEMVEATAAAWGKTTVRCRSTPGFIVNRVARPFYGEALRLLMENAADVATLDAVLRDCGGFRMGPFELMDLIGNDVNYAVTKSVYDAMSQDPRYKPSLVQRELVDAGLFGRKSGRGFYDYRDTASRPPAIDAPSGPKPAHVVIEGDLGIATPLAGLAEAAGLAVERRDGAGVVRVDGTTLALSDGRTATQRTHDTGEPTMLFDLALDYTSASRIAIAGPDQHDLAPVAKAAGFFQAIGKAVSVLDDAPGLAVMRTVAMLANEAADALHQQIATTAGIDLAMRMGVNYPVGPLAWADAVGPAHCLRTIDHLAAVYGEDRYRASPLLRRMALSQRQFHS